MSVALGINNSGLIVGYAYTSAPTANNARAFLFSNGSMQDLNNSIPASGWRLADATGINDYGLICGYGTNPSGQNPLSFSSPTQLLVSVASPMPQSLQVGQGAGNDREQCSGHRG